MWDQAVFSEPFIASEREYSQSARTSAENSKLENFGQSLYFEGKFWSYPGARLHKVQKQEVFLKSLENNAHQHVLLAHTAYT